MKTLFRESFLKDVQALGDSAIRKRVRKVVAQVEQAATRRDVKNLKKLKGGDQYFRIRIGDYRLGLVLQDDAVVFVRCLHRRDILPPTHDYLDRQSGTLKSSEGQGS